MIFPLYKGIQIARFGYWRVDTISYSGLVMKTNFYGPKPKPTSLDMGTTDEAVMFGPFF